MNEIYIIKKGYPTMISTPQEIEQSAVAIANWIIYNNRPFVIPTEDGKQVYLAVLNQEDYIRLQAPQMPAVEPEPVEAEIVEEE